MTRRPAIALSVCLASLAACGGSEPSSPADPATERAVTDVIQDYGAALEEKRYDEVCTEIFTAEHAEGYDGVGGCERFLSEATPETEGVSLSVEDVTVDGDVATASFTASGRIGGSQPVPGQAATATLVKEEDGWRIDSLAL